MAFRALRNRYRNTDQGHTDQSDCRTHDHDSQPIRLLDAVDHASLQRAMKYLGPAFFESAKRPVIEHFANFPDAEVPIDRGHFNSEGRKLHKLPGELGVDSTNSSDERQEPDRIGQLGP